MRQCNGLFSVVLSTLDNVHVMVAHVLPMIVLLPGLPCNSARDSRLAVAKTKKLCHVYVYRLRIPLEVKVLGQA